MRRSYKAILSLVFGGLCLFAWEAAGKQKATLRIESPLGPGHFISVRGNGGGLTWEESGARAAKEVSPGVWTVEFDLDRMIEYKLLLDNKYWIDFGPNVTLSPGEIRTIVDPDFLTDAHGSVGELRVGGRIVRVYVPPSYQRGSGKKYPVIYMQDGDKLFVTGPGGWNAQGTMDQMILQGRRPPSIVVGIDPLSPESRMSEYTPFPGVIHENSEQTQFGKAGGDLLPYAKHLVEEIKPAIDAAYDTLPGLLDTTIGGSSLGGVASLAIAVTYPDTFGDVIGMSGTWFWGEVVRNQQGQVVRRNDVDPRTDVVYEPHFSVAQYVREKLELRKISGKPLPRVFLSVGESEWPIMQRSVAVMASQLQSIGYQLEKNLFLYRNPLGRHSEQSWSWQLRVPLTRLKSRDSCRDCLLPRPPSP